MLREFHDEFAGAWISTCIIFQFLVMVWPSFQAISGHWFRLVPVLVWFTSLVCGAAYSGLFMSGGRSGTAGVLQFTCVWGILLNDMYLTWWIASLIPM